MRLRRESTPTSGSDLVTVSYNVDGSIATRTDQRGVVMTYDYDTARRFKAERQAQDPTELWNNSFTCAITPNAGD